MIIDNPEITGLNGITQDYILKNDSLQNLEQGFGTLWHCRRNCYPVLVDNDPLFISWEPASADSLRQKIFEFLKNEEMKISLSDSRPYKETGVSLSMGMVILRYDTILTHYTQNVLRQIARGINDYRDYFAKQVYDMEFTDLSEKRKAELDETFLWRLMITDGIEIPPTPPEEMVSPAIIEKVD